MAEAILTDRAGPQARHYKIQDNGGAAAPLYPEFGRAELGFLHGVGNLQRLNPRFARLPRLGKEDMNSQEPAVQRGCRLAFLKLKK